MSDPGQQSAPKTKREIYSGLIKQYTAVYVRLFVSLILFSIIVAFSYRFLELHLGLTAIRHVTDTPDSRLWETQAGTKAIGIRGDSHFESRLAAGAYWLALSAQDVQEYGHVIAEREKILNHIALARKQEFCGAYGYNVSASALLVATISQKKFQAMVERLSVFEAELRHAADRNDFSRYLHSLRHWQFPEHGFLDTLYDLEDEVVTLMEERSENMRLLRAQLHDVDLCIADKGSLLATATRHLVDSKISRLHILCRKLGWLCSSHAETSFEDLRVLDEVLHRDDSLERKVRVVFRATIPLTLDPSVRHKYAVGDGKQFRYYPGAAKDYHFMAERIAFERTRVQRILDLMQATY